ncbi:MAG: MucR family transcriptional regulator [Sandarakinorhabdus sp.]|nr:MucR family transcriptional regulator [Sandarakinorhabdus sp.]
MLILTADLVRAYLQRNLVPASALPALIRAVHDSLGKLGAPPAAAPVAAATAAVSTRKSLASPEHIISMIDGKPYRTLKRHIGGHGMTPEAYRRLYRLPDDYPMIAPAYSAKRSAISKSLGLGRKAADAAPTAPARRTLKIAGPKGD